MNAETDAREQGHQSGGANSTSPVAVSGLSRRRSGWVCAVTTSDRRKPDTDKRPNLRNHP